MKKFTFSKGFTLIELLIVITIIGILAVALLPSVLGAPARARDAARKADLNNIVAALETYNSDKQHYPADEDICIYDLKDGGSTAGILETYFSGGKSPKDPQGKPVPGSSTCADSYAYTVGTGNVSYYLGAFMEVEGDMNTKDPWPKTSVSAQPALTPGASDNTYFVVIK